MDLLRKQSKYSEEVMHQKSQSTKRKVAVFVPDFPGLTETFIARDLSELARQGELDIVICRLKEGRGEIPANLAPLVKNFRINLLDCFLALKYFGNFQEIFHLARTELSTLRALYLSLKSLAYASKFDKLRVDEIHAHFLSEPSSIAMFVGIVLNIPFSVNAHAKDVLVYPQFLKEKTKRAKFITVCNSHAFDRLIFNADQNSLDKIFLLYHGVDESIFQNIKVDMPKPDVPFIFMGGTRLVEKKGHEYMIRASKILIDRGVNHMVKLIAPGPLYEKLQSLVVKLGLEKVFFIDGNGAPFSKIAHYYFISDIVVLPFIETEDSDADGIPNVAIEAALAKRPIVTTNAGSISELVDETTGIVVPQKDPEALATGIEKLIFDPDLRNKLGHAVYSRAIEMFDLTKNVTRLAQVLK